jgi:hypothetical protein
MIVDGTKDEKDETEDWRPSEGKDHPGAAGAIDD